MDFRVWAPRATRVELLCGGERTEMAAEGGGWFSTRRPDAAPDCDYQFCLDGGAPLADPRSRHQPRGPHAPSRLVDFAAFNWTDAGYSAPLLSSGLVYELHVGTFSPEGTFAGVVSRLDHLVSLGVSHLSLMPVADFPGLRGWGYDGVGLWAVHRAYGGPRGLMELVDACHARGIAVLRDVVYNHLGPDGNQLEAFGPYFSDEHHTPWGRAINLDGRGSDEVRRYFIENALSWLEQYHVDGLRLDAVHALFDRSSYHFLQELSDRVHELGRSQGRRLVLIAESDSNDPRLLRSPSAGGYGIDAQWSDDFHHALHAWLSGERAGYYADFGCVKQLAAALNDGFVYSGQYSRFRERRHGAKSAGLSADRLLGYTQTHDQVGNRPLGERLCQLVGEERARIAAGVLFSAPFVPMLFQGEEWGASTPFLYFTHHSRAELGDAIAAGRLREHQAFGWPAAAVPPPQALETFEASRLRWEELEQPAAQRMLGYYRRLAELRRSRPDLRDSSFARARALSPRVLRIDREFTTVLCSIAPAETALDWQGGKLLIASHSGVCVRDGRVVLPSDSLAVLEGGWAR